MQKEKLRYKKGRNRKILPEVSDGTSGRIFDVYSFTKYSRFVMWAVKAQARRNIVTKWHALPPITNRWKISWEPKFLCFALKIGTFSA